MRSFCKKTPKWSHTPKDTTRSFRGQFTSIAHSTRQAQGNGQRGLAGPKRLVWRLSCRTGRPNGTVSRNGGDYLAIWGSRSTGLVRSGNAEVTADFLHEVVGDLAMTRHGGPMIERRISPPRMVLAFANQFATMLPHMTNKISPLQTAARLLQIACQRPCVHLDDSCRWLRSGLHASSREAPRASRPANSRLALPQPNRSTTDRRAE